MPPLDLIQVLYGEASGQARNGDTVSEPAVGSAIKNRFGNSAFPGGSSAQYQNVITSGQFAGLSVGSFITNSSQSQVAQYELPVVSSLFTGAQGDTVAGAPCFFSETPSDWTNIKAALQSGTTTYPSLSGNDPRCFALTTYGPQIVYKASIGTSIGYGGGVPAFVFQRQRTSASTPVVVEIP